MTDTAVFELTQAFELQQQIPAEPLRIAFLVDGILDGFYARFSRWWNLAYGAARGQILDETGSNWASASIEETLGCSTAEARLVADEFFAFWAMQPEADQVGDVPYGAPEVLNGLFMGGIELYALTLRRDDHIPFTTQWLEWAYPGLFTNRVRSMEFWLDPTLKLDVDPADLCRLLNACIIVDHRPAAVQSAAAMGFWSVLFGQLPWTIRGQERLASVPYVRRAQDWYDLAAAIAEIKTGLAP